MKINRLMLIAVIITLGTYYSSAQSPTSLPTAEFAKKIQQLPTSPVVDVRTPAEYAEGHLPNARNIDWNGSDFEKSIVKLDKSKPVFVYCLRQTRTAAAASRMRSMGFKEVYELSGGIAAWRSARLPETR